MFFKHVPEARASPLVSNNMKIISLGVPFLKKILSYDNFYGLISKNKCFQKEKKHRKRKGRKLGRIYFFEEQTGPNIALEH